jgi:hypothetical protein
MVKPIITEEKLLELLPHGSGIDYKYEFTFHKNGNITIKNAFHAMNENGYYDGIMPFIIHLYRHKQDIFNALKGPIARKGDIDFSIRCNDKVRNSFYDLKNYLLETYYHALTHILTHRNETL